jgi:hypothetical protein
LGDQSVTRRLPTQHNTNKKKCRQTSMPGMDLEPTTQVFGSGKTVLAINNEATVIGQLILGFQ